MTAYDEIAKGVGFTSWEALQRYIGNERGDILPQAYQGLKLAVNWLCVLHGLKENL